MTDRLYLRPTGFVDAPFGYDGQMLRLAGGLTFFAMMELIHVRDGDRVSQTLVPVQALESALSSFSSEIQEQARTTISRLTAPRTTLKLAARTIPLDQPQVMGIVNVTPDSFSDGGMHQDPTAHAMDMLQAGAALIDVGGESTRPGAKPVWEGDEIERVRPVIELLAASGAAVSIDTRKAGVMEAAFEAGAGLVNDVSALSWDARALEVVAMRGCPVVLMHHQGAPETMQQDPRYDDVLIEVHDWLEARIAIAVAAGIDRANILVDPGIGFGKTLRHNLTLLNNLSLFHGLGCPIVLGVSRKRSIGALSGEAPVDQRLGGSIALAVLAAAQGVQLHRVHDAFETVQALRVWRGLRDEALSPI
ncbi:MAG TPA: dihydropteroate synthase [Sphingomonas sp.]|uniref:dihydropteroate synthase n=1 Tax=Sphingomonas sp. TaxID=28214 RepID=UPI002C7D4552|nr:dihydropteroate synthase [Sphingomonas sp.]HMI18058.1 dihydropteroate synthase [Sphingomonas sp.]